MYLETSVLTYNEAETTAFGQNGPACLVFIIHEISFQGYLMHSAGTHRHENDHLI